MRHVRPARLLPVVLLGACAARVAPQAPAPAPSPEAAPPAAPSPEAPPFPAEPVPLTHAAAVATPVPLRQLDEDGLAALLRNPSGGTVVVNFWATWCGPCVDELGALHEAAAEHPEARFLLVSVDGANAGPQVDAFLRDHDVTLPVLHLTAADPSATLRRQVPGWPDSIPLTLVLAPGGVERARFDGLLDEAALGRALE